jgi:hypothetical protein
VVQEGRGDHGDALAGGLMDEVCGRVAGVEVVLTWCEAAAGEVLLDGPGGLDVRDACLGGEDVRDQP